MQLGAVGGVRCRFVGFRCGQCEFVGFGLGSLRFVGFGEVSPACAGALLAQALLVQDVVVVAFVAGEVGAAWRRGAGSAGGGCGGFGGWRAGGARACVRGGERAWLAACSGRAAGAARVFVRGLGGCGGRWGAAAAAAGAAGIGRGGTARREERRGSESRVAPTFCAKNLQDKALTLYLC